MNRLKKKIRFYLIPSLLFIGVLVQSNGVDFNNTQVPKDIFDKALSWGDLQVRNSILYTPNAEQPHNGFIKKLYENTQVEILLRLSEGQINQVNRWKENGMPLYSVEVLPSSISFESIPESSEQLDVRTFHGITRFWYPTGQSMLEAKYSYGKKNGTARSWYENGNLKVEENYKDGLKDGNARSWFENGKKWMTYTHWNDKRDGPLIWWFENGQKRQEGNYKGGQRFGEWAYYKEDGSILYRKTFRDGKSISTKYGEDDSEE
jgi:antitoxin component YwqK of YwqJK toxin-antitoxin module